MRENLDKARENQSKLLENLVKCSNKSRPKNKEGKYNKRC